MFLLLILCFFVNLKAQSDIIISESNNYLLRVRNLGNNIIHFHLIYSGAQGAQEYERYVDEEYKKKNLPFISDVNSLFD